VHYIATYNSIIIPGYVPSLGRVAAYGPDEKKKKKKGKCIHKLQEITRNSQDEKVSPQLDANQFLDLDSLGWVQRVFPLGRRASCAPVSKSL
jgi:hypothetical protein